MVGKKVKDKEIWGMDDESVGGKLNFPLTSSCLYSLGLGARASETAQARVGEWKYRVRMYENKKTRRGRRMKRRGPRRIAAAAFKNSKGKHHSL